MNEHDYLGYYSRGTTYYYNKDYDKAIENYNKAIALNPNYTEAINNRSLAFIINSLRMM